MNVKELIEKLQTIDNKDLPVFIYDQTSTNLYPIIFVDGDISDRVDLNFEQE